MTITLDISPEAERELQQRAKIEGIDMSKLAAEILEGVALVRNVQGNLHGHSKSYAQTAAERVAALDDLIAHGISAPSISDEALSSEELYD